MNAVIVCHGGMFCFSATSKAFLIIHFHMDGGWWRIYLLYLYMVEWQEEQLVEVDESCRIMPK